MLWDKVDESIRFSVSGHSALSYAAIPPPKFFRASIAEPSRCKAPIEFMGLPANLESNKDLAA